MALVYVCVCGVRGDIQARRWVPIEMASLARKREFLSNHKNN